VSVAVYLDTAPADRHDGPARLRAAGFEVRDAVAGSAEQVVDAARGAEALLVGDSPVTGETIAALEGLRIVATVTVGVDQVDVSAAHDAGVWVANVPDAVSEEVAVSALAMMLGLVRHIPFLDRSVRAGGWDPFATGPRRRPSSLTLGIVGLGRTGARLAALAAPCFGRVLGHDPAPQLPPPAAVELVTTLDELLAASDVVSLHVPAVPGAPALVDGRALARMRSGAYLVNVARGGLVDTDALLDALDAGLLAGAALDVVAGEPPAADAAIRRHPRVVLTPHAAFWSEESEAAAYAAQAENVVAWRRSGRPLTPVGEPALGASR
jgi:phosphoglycerate dehydrogenase-like enzyme